MWSMAKIRSKEYGQRWLLDATLPEATTDCCVVNTIGNRYYWCFEVANVVADGRFRKKTMIMWLKGMWIKDIS